MRAVIVGVGTIGTMYAGYLRDGGHEAVLVDRDGRYRYREVGQVPRPAEVDAWVVATPTATHVDVVRAVLAVAPRAAVLLEKPACHPGQLAAISALAAAHPEARLVVNDVYAHSSAVRDLSDLVARRAAADPIRRISIEFTKNRAMDVDNGRFIDTVYGDVGYEWFHLLSILRRVVPPETFRRYLRTRPGRVTSEVRTETRLPGPLDIVLYSSVNGVIGLPHIGLAAFDTATPRQELAAGLIPYGSTFRYRVAAIEFASGAVATLVFESRYGRVADYKNVHAVRLSLPGEVEHRHEISENQLRSALFAQMAAMGVPAADPLDALQLDVHRHMAGLSGSLRATPTADGPRTPGRSEVDIVNTYFVPEQSRVRLTAAEILDRYPELTYDEEQYDDARPDVPYLWEVLERYVAQVTGAAEPAWEWDEAAAGRVRRHPVYAGDEYAVPAFADLPTLNRAALRRHPDPFDYQAEPTPVIYTDKTSGTSGAPLAVAYCQRFMSQSLYLEIPKIMLGAGLTGIGARPVASVFLTDNPSRGQGVLVPNPLDAVGHGLVLHVDPNDDESLDRVGRMLMDLRPEVVSSKPGLFRLLIDRWRTRSPFGAYRPRLAVSGGAMLTDDLRAALTEVLGCPVVSSYAVSELGYLGSECPHGRMHLDLSVHERFEVLPAAGDPDSTGELVVTSLSNSCMPMLRYRVGDVVRLGEPCACGRPGPALAELRGRVTQIFDLGGGVQLVPTCYMKIFERHPALLEYQLTQTADRSFRLRVEIDPDVRAPERPRIAADVCAYVADGMPVPVDIDCAETVFDTEAGKFTRFRSEVQRG